MGPRGKNLGNRKIDPDSKNNLVNCSSPGLGVIAYIAET